MAKYITKLINGEELYYLKDSEARANLIDKSEKGAASGVATLDSSGKVPSSQLPSYVDDVIEGYYINGHFYDIVKDEECVKIGDLWWKTKNVDANSITDTGLYFQWGDAQGYTAALCGSGEGQKYFGLEDYKYANSISGLTKYNKTDGKVVLDIEDDAARAAWGGSWRMPTTEEYVALGAAVDTAWTADYQGSGVRGLICTDKTDSSKVLFFPACGDCRNGSVRSVGSYGNYWSSSLSSGNVQLAYSLSFGSSYVYWRNDDFRCVGYPVRAVSSVEPQTFTEITAETGKIYIDLYTNQSYRWSGSTYIVISSQYELPTASANTLGGVKVGDGLSIDSNGILSAESGSSVEVVLTTGTSTEAVMSLNAVTNHIEDTEIHVTATEKEYWNSKVNPPSYSAPTAKQLTYTGEAQELLNPGSSTAGSIQYSTDEVNWSTTIPQATNAGTYTVYWKFAGSEIVYVDSTAISVTIAKAAPAYTAPTAKSGLVYNASAQDLLNAGTSSDGTISYSSDNENWGSSILQGTNADSYTVYWKLNGDANHNDIASTAINVSIAKVTPTVVTPTAKTGLVYTGSAQELVNAGSTDWGTLQYSLDNETYGTSIPSGTNAGDYTVYYKVVGDSNVNDVAAQSVSCSIAKVNSTITMSGNSTNMSVGQTNILTISVAGGATPTITSSNTSVATVSGYTISAVGVGTTTITISTLTDDNHNGDTVTYTLTVKWPNGIYAAYADGSMRTAENADTNAIGVAVITDNCSFIIDKIYNRNTMWDSQYSTNGVIAGCFATDDTNTAKTNYTGVSNTNAIAAVASGGEAAKYCRSCSKTIAGKTVYGYLGACGEWQTAYDNKTTVNSIMSTIGGAAVSSGYWTSTLSLSRSDFAWSLLWFDGTVSGNGTKFPNGRLVRPFYEIS